MPSKYRVYYGLIEVRDGEGKPWRILSTSDKDDAVNTLNNAIQPNGKDLVLTPEIIGPIMRDAYWWSIIRPPWTDKGWKKVATRFLEKLNELKAVKLESET